MLDRVESVKKYVSRPGVFELLYDDALMLARDRGVVAEKPGFGKSYWLQYRVRFLGVIGSGDLHRSAPSNQFSGCLYFDLCQRLPRLRSSRVSRLNAFSRRASRACVWVIRRFERFCDLDIDL